MKPLTTLILLCISLLSTAQTPKIDPAYAALVDTAFAKMQRSECQPCLDLYLQAFDISQHSALSHLRAATCAYQCGKKDLGWDLATKAVAIDWSVCEAVINNPLDYPEFDALKGSDLRIYTKAIIREAAEASGIDLDLAEMLSEIEDDDQYYRRMADSMGRAHQRDSEEYQAFMKKWEERDAECLQKIEGIIAVYGYPGKSLVGSEYASSAWLVIQHAPLEKQEYYLPMITEAAEKGEMPKSNWALLVDRIRMRHEEPQLYGSQVMCDPDCHFYKIEDEANVNQRRREVGLGPLEEYAKRFGFEWTPPKG